MDRQKNQSEIIFLINSILSHKKEYIQNFLKSKNIINIPQTKEDLKESLINLSKEEKITQKDLTLLLDEIETFKNKQIYMFDIQGKYLNKLRNANFIKSIFEKENLKEVLNNYKSIILPARKEVISISYNEDWLRILWVDKKEKFELQEEKKKETREKEEILVKKYLVKKLRVLSLFQVSLITGNAELLIHFLPGGYNYNQEKTLYLNQLNEWFNFGILESLNLHSAISKIGNSDEVRIRNLGIRTPRGSHIDIVSPSITQGIHDDIDISNAKINIKTGIGNKGNFYWLKEKSNGVLIKEIHTIISKDRVALFGEYQEREVNYVLARIRHFIG